MKKFVDLIFIIIFMILLFLPLIFMNHKKNYESTLDNKILKDISLKSLTRDDLTVYVSDRIGFRKFAINSNIKIKDFLFSELVHPIYMYGKEKHVFFKIKPTTNKVDKEFINLFCVFLRKVQDYCLEKNVPFLYCINPSKTSVYKSKLPSGYVYKNYFLEYLYEKLDENKINYISNVELLEEKSFEESVFNKKYDAGHWNDLGQIYGTNNILAKMSENFPDVQLLSLGDFEKTTIIQESLPVAYFKINEPVDIYRLKKIKSIDLSKEYKDIKLHKNYKMFRFYQSNDEQIKAKNLPTVLFFHGSYYNRNAQMYMNSFPKIWAVHNYQNFLEFDYYFELFEPNYVVLETAEYATSREYFDIKKIQEKIDKLQILLQKHLE